MNGAKNHCNFQSLIPLWAQWRLRKTRVEKLCDGKIKRAKLKNALFWEERCAVRRYFKYADFFPSQVSNSANGLQRLRKFNTMLFHQYKWQMYMTRFWCPSTKLYCTQHILRRVNLGNVHLQKGACLNSKLELGIFSKVLSWKTWWAYNSTHKTSRNEIT